MGDLPEDAHVSASPKDSEVTLTVGFLNEKVWISFRFVCFTHSALTAYFSVNAKINRQKSHSKVCSELSGRESLQRIIGESELSLESLLQSELSVKFLRDSKQ